MGYIYVIENKVNNKKYVGQTINPDMRWKRHIQQDMKKSNCLIGNAFKKWGLENFEFTVIEECENHKMSEREQYYIKYYNTYVGYDNANGYNMTIGGEALYSENNPFYGKTHSEETRKIMSKKAKRKTGELNPFYGKRHSEETKEKWRKIKTGKKATLETRKKMSEAQKGDKNHFYGKHHSDETKAKIRQKHMCSFKAVKEDEVIVFKDRNELLKWFIEKGVMKETCQPESAVRRVLDNKNKPICGYYLFKSVETIPDECKEVGLEIGTNSKCTASIK
jgi:group I intron endonuclease